MPSTSGEWQLPTAQPLFALQGVRGGVTARATRELWRHLPAWMFLLYGCLLLNCELTNFSPPRADLAPTVMFPLAVFCVYYAARSLWAPDVGNRRGMLFLTIGLALGVPLLNVSYHRPFPLAEDTLRWVYELTNFVWAGVLAVHAWRRARTDAILCFGAGLLYGLLLENGGILLGFFQETHLRSMAPPLVAPVATMIGWSLVLYMALFVVRGLRAALPGLRRSAFASALAMVAATLLLDLQLDPVATGVRCWVWAPSLPGFFHGVPLVNFVAWFCAIFPLGYALFRFQTLERLADRSAWSRRQLAIAFASVPAVLGVAAVLFLASMAALEGTTGPSYELLFRFAAQLFPL